MARNRVIYQSEALYAGPSPATGNHFSAGNVGTNNVNQLQRVQTCNYSFNIARTDVNQFGELAAIDRVILESPTVSLDFSYILGSLVNEDVLGFAPLDSFDVTCISGILNKTQDERNYFIRTTAEGADAKGVGSGVANQNVIGIGNGFITSYSTEASVGNFPTVTVNVEGLNMQFDAGVTGNHIPAVIPTDGSKITGKLYALPNYVSDIGSTTVGALSALRPGDITFDLGQVQGGVTIADAKIQSYTLSFDLAREPLQKLGSKFAFAREITFPVTVNLSIDAQVGDLTTGSLADIITNDRDYDLQINLKHPVSGTNQVSYRLEKAKLDSQEFSSSIGANKSVTLNFSSQIGGPGQTDRGLFMSGVKD
jgi:hypothetical protein